MGVSLTNALGNLVGNTLRELKDDLLHPIKSLEEGPIPVGDYFSDTFQTKADRWDAQHSVHLPALGGKLPSAVGSNAQAAQAQIARDLQALKQQGIQQAQQQQAAAQQAPTAPAPASQDPARQAMNQIIDSNMNTSQMIRALAKVNG